MADAVINFFRELLNNDRLTIFIISMLPIIELRGAIPVAIKMGLSWYQAFGFAFLGSIIVAPILLLILMPILNAMKKIKIFRGLANAVESLFQSKAESVRKKAKKADSKNTEDIIKMVGVFLFVAIPLPLTGVWTGTAVAVFLGLGFWKSLLAVSLGNISSGLIMTGLSLLFKDNLNLFLTIFMIAVLTLLILNIIYLVVKSHLKKKKAIINGEQIDVNNDTEQGNVDAQNSDNINENAGYNNALNADNEIIEKNVQNNCSHTENNDKPCENRDIITKIDTKNVKNDDKQDINN